VFKAKETGLVGYPNEEKLYTQLAQSPDLNVNNIGFFNSLQSRYYRIYPKNSIELIKLVDNACKNYPLEVPNRMWLTLQSVVNKITEERGDNTFKTRHLNKRHARKNGPASCIYFGNNRSTQLINESPNRLMLHITLLLLWYEEDNLSCC
jgi:hypothetical protein